MLAWLLKTGPLYQRCCGGRNTFALTAKQVIFNWHNHILPAGMVAQNRCLETTIDASKPQIMPQNQKGASETQTDASKPEPLPQYQRELRELQ